MSTTPHPADDGTAMPPYDQLLDERGSVCPMPVIALAKALKVAPNETILLLADDPAAASDVPAWCGLRSRALIWSGPAPDGRGQGFVIAPGQER
jgi:tRNA 2-thiouridine synthesizing protein A